MNYKLYLLLLLPMVVWTQEAQPTVDTEYREDQFYVGITYNLLLDLPTDISQNDLSNGLYLGFIKDLPINERRNRAFGVGLGYNINTYFSNLIASQSEGGITFTQENSNEFQINRLTTHILEVPLEYRWRTSTPESHAFWRIYGGAKLGYVFANSSRFQNDERNVRFGNDALRRFRYGLYVSAGYNTWNFYVYYGLDTLFKNNTLTENSQEITTRDLKIGLMFYIL